MTIIILCDDDEVLPSKFAAMADVVVRNTRVVKNVDAQAEKRLLDAFYALQQPTVVTR